MLTPPPLPKEEPPGWSCAPRPLPAGLPRVHTWISTEGSECSGRPLPNGPGLWSEKGGRSLPGALGTVPVHCSPVAVRTGPLGCSLPGATGPKEGAGSTRSALTWTRRPEPAEGWLWFSLPRLSWKGLSPKGSSKDVAVPAWSLLSSSRRLPPRKSSSQHLEPGALSRLTQPRHRRAHAPGASSRHPITPPPSRLRL